jgi:hypothetical protein
MVLTVSFVLSPVIGLVCHRRLRSCLRKLDAGVEASGPHDFAVRKRRPRQQRRLRPSHPVPNVRDDRETPLVWDGMAMFIEVIWLRKNRNIFCDRAGQGKSTSCR